MVKYNKNYRNFEGSKFDRAGCRPLGFVNGKPLNVIYTGVLVETN